MGGIYNLCLSQTLVNASVNNNMLTIVNAANTADTIISPNGQKLWEAFSTGEHLRPSLTPAISWQPVTNGCNIIYTFHNNSPVNTIFSLGKIQVGGIRFKKSILSRAFQNTGEERKYSNPYNPYNPTNYSSSYAYSSYYPKSLFSPVMTLNDTAGKYTVCLSVLYPVLDLKHNIHPILYSTNNLTSNGRSWTSSFSLNNYYLDSLKNSKLYLLPNVDSNIYSYKGDINPGEIRSYTLCIRVITNANPCESWEQGLQPYKDYFKNLYGGIQYTSDKRPISRSNIASGTPAIGNPYGFTVNKNLRPDLHGFGPLAHYFIDRKYTAMKYERFILWLPSGSQWENRPRNMPFKFTSHWFEGNKAQFPHSYGHKMGDAIDSLRLIPAPNREFGLWWGRSGQIMFDWDTSYYEVLNPNNPKHVNAAFRELDSAVAIGTKLIGLDAFREEMPAWDGYEWLKKMRARVPQIKFITERWGCDIQQTLAGMIGLDRESLPIVGPHYLSDFLLPGSEKVGILFDRDTTKAMRLAKMTLLNSWGYVACSTGDTLPDSGSYLAEEYWHQYDPYPDLGMNKKICDTIVLSAIHQSFISHLWSNGATTNAITVTSPGTYFVQTNTLDGCIIYDTIVLSPCVYYGVKQNDADKISISVYPNPASETTTIKFNDYKPGDDYEIKLYNVMGELIKEKVQINTSEFVLTVGNLSKGIYMLYVENSEGAIAIKKLIIE